MGTREAPSRLAEALAAETGEPPETYDAGSREIRSLDEAVADPEEVEHTPDELPVEFGELDLDATTELPR
ncbi:MAG: hypothetical protein ABEI99_08105 [Halobaculum sp.]